MKRFSICFSALFLTLTSTAFADCTVTLEGSQEVPAVNPAGSGSATVTIDSVTGVVSVTGTYTGMTSNVIAAHIHRAGAGVNGAVIQSLTISGGTTGTISGGGTLTASEVNALVIGNTYINVHTSNNGGGEIRGQITCNLNKASATSRNGTGVNPNIFTTSDVPQLGKVWNAQVDNTGVAATLMAIFLGAPIPNGVNLGIGQLLCLPPRIGTQTTADGVHTLGIPNDCTLMGLNVCMQGGTFNNGNIQLANAIDLFIGI